ncbi:MAG: 4-phosphopantetheinyl transferase family protein [Deltaproteobacteria bacterium]|nr:4-phosphopantetheinyl transferase family protein [Deltaproteobacteria bacterium]
MSTETRAPDPSARSRDQIGHAAIRTLAAGVLGESVVFASTPSHLEAGQDLASMLMQAMGKMDPCWRILPGSPPLTLYKKALGQPGILLGGRPGPSLSFSHGEGQTWAAICGTGSIGIDVAHPQAFAGAYPLARAFRPEELDIVKILGYNDIPRGAALLWSAKEAAVKATGTGFNRFDPLDVRVGVPHLKAQGIGFEVMAGHPIPTWATSEGQGWISIALKRAL